MKTLRVVLGDQLTRTLAALRDYQDVDVVLMVEVHDETVYVRHHKQKIAFILAAMRHFAAALQAEGVTVDYVKLDAPGNTGSFPDEVTRAVARHRPDRIVVTEPGEYRVRRLFDDWAATAAVPLEMRADDRFLCPSEVFADWLGDKRSPTMEYFYRLMRRRTGYLMNGDEPLGGQWNFDAENRKRYPRNAIPPQRLVFAPDATTQEVLALVAARFGEHFGDLEPFAWPVTRPQAEAALAHFIEHVLPGFGDYQDAMVQGAPFLHHALLSPCLNAGLLTAKEVCDAAEAAYGARLVPLNAAEGFIRQVIGWREYVRGLYWRLMPAYADSNALNATRDLPWFYWSGETDLNCLKQVIGETRAHAYAHHIQRLMVTGNFALLAGVAPRQIEEWYLIVYADAYDWVELPNVHGMVMWADGGVLGTKPYAASGAYIDRMSDYCRGCRYDVKQKTGPDACPFNYLYWNFLSENEQRLAGNPRLAMPYRNLARMDKTQRATIAADSRRFFERIGLKP
ncbi:(6-4) photolyase [Alphaproteobacteria bacterium SO-S41]|nr:(6-4) photolyase [Alphaproteobacteria bacterium SO-S41]